MGKKLIIPGANFSANAIPVATAVNGTTSPQYVYIGVNFYTPNYEAAKTAIQINPDGSILKIIIPDNVTDLNMFACGDGTVANIWLKDIDFSMMNTKNITSIAFALSNCKSLGKVNFTGADLNKVTLISNFFKDSVVDDVIIDSYCFPSITSAVSLCERAEYKRIEFKEGCLPLISGLNYFFRGCKIHEIIGLEHLINSNKTSITSMFYEASLPSTMVFNVDASNVTNMSQFMCGVRRLGGTALRLVDLSLMNIADDAVDINTNKMFSIAHINEVNANCFTRLSGNLSDMFYMYNWNTIHLDNLNDVSDVTSYKDLFSSYTTGTPKVTIANVTNADVKTMLISALNDRSVGGSSNWQESVDSDGRAILVPNV